MRRSAEVTEETRARASSPANNTLQPPGRMTVIYVSYLIAALDMTLTFLQFSVTPFLAIKLGMDTLQFGYLQTTVGMIQLFGGPMFGRFGDIFGARAALTVSCLASTVFFLLLAIANHPILLFIHKLPTVFMHVMPVTQMVVADLSQPEKRADALSKFGLCFGFGMIIGSTSGGQLVKRYGESLAACVGAAGSVLNLLLVLRFIPQTTKQGAPQSHTKSENDKQSLFNVSEITRLMKYPRVMRTFVVKIVSGLPSVIFQVMFSIIALEFFKLQPEQNGYLMAYFGIVQMVVQGGVIGRLTARYPEYWLLVLSIGVAAMVGLAQALMQTVFHLCLTVIPMVFSLSVFNVITDSMLTKSVPSSDTGTMLGLCASVQSLLRTMGPTLGGYLYVNHGLPAIGYSQFSVNAFVFVYLLLRRINRAPKQSE